MRELSGLDIGVLHCGEATQARGLLKMRRPSLFHGKDMYESPSPLQTRIARQIAEREAALSPLRACAMITRSASVRSRVLLTLALLDQELAGWKEVAARIEQAALLEPRHHRAIRMPALR
ncbi:hypothetical protein AWB71_00127 [Caballeronia peredens]|nr:hypothetical protein AWB71_00127 [Caballeronia peredens]